MSDRSANATWLLRPFEESAASSRSWSMNRWRECSRREVERVLSKVPAGLAQIPDYAQNPQAKANRRRKLVLWPVNSSNLPIADVTNGASARSPSLEFPGPLDDSEQKSGGHTKQEHPVQ
jgi:hypothetical protein